MSRYVIWGFVVGAILWFIIFVFSDNKADAKKEQRQIILNHFSA